LPNGENNEASGVYLDLSGWKEERESLDDSFKASRAFFTKHGPWILPDGIPENKFSDVAKLTLIKMDRYEYARDWKRIY
jgi:hypothetical protein